MKLLLLCAFYLATAKITYPEEFPGSYATPLMDFPTFFKLSLDKNLTSFEIQSIFLLMDHNKDGKIDKTEYSSFYLLFIEPFESNCDVKGNYTLSVADLKGCVDKMESFATLKKLAESNENLIEKSLRILSFNTTPNFYTFLVLRRYSFSCKYCNCSNSLSANKFACVLNFISDSEFNRIEIDSLYKLSLRFNKKQPEMSFLAFFFSSILFSRFNAIQSNARKSFITREMFESAHEQGVLGLSTNFTTIQKILFQVETEPVDFKTFFYTFKAVFDVPSGSIKNHEGLKKTIEGGPNEFYEILTLCEPKILENQTKPENPDLTEYEKTLDFEVISSFLEFEVHRGSASKTKKSRGFYEILFNMFDFNDDGVMDVGELVQLWKFTGLFRVFDTEKTCLVSSLSLRRNLEFLEETIVLAPDERKALLEIFKISKKSPVNLIEFLAVFVHDSIFKRYYEKENLLYKINWPMISIESFKAGVEKLGLQIKENSIEELKFEVETGWIYRIDYKMGFYKSLNEYSEQLGSKFMNRTFV